MESNYYYEKEVLSMSVIETKNLKKSFGSTQALRGIDITVEKGDIYGFIGPNGAGKTTTIRILLGILKASEGSARVFGKDVWEDAVEIHRKIAFVPGEVNLWPNLTGGEVIDLLIGLKNEVNVEKKHALIERFKLDPTKKCRSYSRGNKQKIALIAAFAQDADVYILDEPTSGLDPLMERVFQETVKEVQKEGKTIFLSSHILSEVEKLCDKVSIIRDGKIIESGKIEDLRHLTRTRVRIVTKKPVENVEAIDGIYDLDIKHTTYTFQVETNTIGSVLKTFNDHGIEALESTPPTLEDLFMRHYEEA